MTKKPRVGDNDWVVVGRGGVFSFLSRETLVVSASPRPHGLCLIAPTPHSMVHNGYKFAPSRKLAHQWETGDEGVKVRGRGLKLRYITNTFL